MYYSQNYDQRYLDNIEEEFGNYIDKCNSRLLTSFAEIGQMVSWYKPKAFEKIDKKVLRDPIQTVINGLHDGDMIKLKDQIHDILSKPNKKTEYCVSQDGDVYLIA